MDEHPLKNGTIPASDLDALVEHLAEAVAARLGVDRDRLLDRRGLAERLGVCERSVGEMAARGDLPCGYLLGGVRRWSWLVVLKFLEGRTARKPRRGRGRYDRSKVAGDG